MRRVIAAAAVAACALLAPATAFTDTSPLVLYAPGPTSHQLPFLSDAAAAAAQPHHPFADPVRIAKDLVRDGAVCALDAVAVVRSQEMGERRLHAPSLAPLLSAARHADAGARHFAHVLESVASPADELSRRVARRCKGWRVVSQEEDERAASAAATEATTGQQSRAVVLIDGPDPASSVEAFAARHPNHLVILTSAPSSSSSSSSSSVLAKRAKKGGEGHHGDKKPQESAFDPAYYGLFADYQFFTPGLLLVILISSLILLPIAMLGTRLLASVETPDRMSEVRLQPGKDKAQ